MGALLFCFAGFFAACLACEVRLRRGKLQFAFPSVMAIHAAFWGLTLFFICRQAGTSLSLASALFWGGAFLFWFGVRSHIESSISMRLPVMIARHPGQTNASLLEMHARQYGAAPRLREMETAGLIEKDRGGFRVSARGKRAVRAVRWIRRRWGIDEAPERMKREGER